MPQWFCPHCGARALYIISGCAHCTMCCDCLKSSPEIHHVESKIGQALYRVARDRKRAELRDRSVTPGSESDR